MTLSGLVHYSWVWPEGGVSTLALCELWLVIRILRVITTYFTHLGKIPAHATNAYTPLLDNQESLHP